VGDPKVGKDGTTLWGARERQAIERSKGDVVVLIACQNITFRILLQQSPGRPARLDS
jgi:hypothetical protein